MIEVLIVGQGIAGTTLGRFLEKSGVSFMVVDSGKHPAASRVAPGLWNPLAVKRFNKAWLADETFLASDRFYKEEESFFNLSFYHSTGMLKLLSNENEKSQLLQNIERLAPFVSYMEEEIPGIQAPYGYLYIKQAGYVKVSDYLSEVKRHWLEIGIYSEDEFNYSDLMMEGDAWNWNGQAFRKVVFCEGVSGQNNPYLQSLPLGNTKGQVLEVSIEGLSLESILSKNVFVLPLGQDRFKVGSTYEWNFDDLEPTQQGREELMVKLQSLLPDYRIEVNGQKAGGRPTTRDRRPLMGELSSPGLYVFNGLGSRGVMLAPFLAECMKKHLLGDTAAIPTEAHIKRFEKR